MERDNSKDEQFSLSSLKRDGINNFSRLWSLLIVHEMLSNGLKHFFISPGLRNTPIIKATTLFPWAVKIVTIDERSSAYKALGFCKASGMPAALVCTSGSALANYLPAIIEAKKNNLPLVVISCDRPFELVQVNDNQTIEQTNFFENWVTKTLNLPEAHSAITPLKIKKIIATFLNSLKIHPGPLHLNIPLRPPFEQESENIDSNFIKEALSLLNTNSTSLAFSLLPPQVENFDFNFIKANSFDLLIVGELPSVAEKNNIAELINIFQGAIYTDITSGLRHDQKSLTIFELLSFFKTCKIPLNILHLGERLTSKSLYKALSNLPAGTAHFNVSANEKLTDPSFSLTTKLLCDPNEFAKHAIIKSNPFQKVEKQRPLLQDLLSANNHALSFIHLVDAINRIIPNGDNLFLGNSSAIRFFDNYTENFNKKLHLFFNRGVSGIEGNISSACGVNYAKNSSRTTLVLGDISFIHDLGALVDLNKAPGKIIIILVNDFGGGIFKQLPIAEDSAILEIITTSHKYTFELLARQFSINYFANTSVEDFEKNYQLALTNPGHFLIEVILDSDKNLKLTSHIENILKGEK